jgi:hypothetical protein
MVDLYEQARRTRRVKVTFNEQQMKILEHYCQSFGMSRAYAVRHLLIGELADWYVKVMKPQQDKTA